MVQIEEVQAVENIDSMLELPDIGEDFIGPADLSVSLGFDMGAPEVESAIQNVPTACRNHGVPRCIKACHPAFVVKSWGEADLRLQCDCETLKLGEQYRVGHRRRPGRTDLVVWTSLTSTNPLRLQVRRHVR